MEREASYGRSGYALQFMLDTQLSDEDRHPLKLRDLLIHSLDTDIAPEKFVYADDSRTVLQDLPMVGFSGDRYLMPFEFARNQDGSVRTLGYTGSVMAIDPSGRGKDETVWCVLKMLNSQLFLVEMNATREGYTDDTLQAIADCAKRNKVNEIVIESNFGDGMFDRLLTPFLTRTYPCTITEVRHSTQKEKRIIDTLEPVLNQHRLIVDPKVVQWDYDSTKVYSTETMNSYRLFYQMTRLTGDRGSLVHDDRLDCPVHSRKLLGRTDGPGCGGPDGPAQGRGPDGPAPGVHGIHEGQQDPGDDLLIGLTSLRWYAKTPHLDVIQVPL